MEKIIGIFLVGLLLVGCKSTPTHVVTDVQKVTVPVLYCSAPPTVERPSSLFADLPQLQQPWDPVVLQNDPEYAGRLVQRYRATIIDLQGYAAQLEQIIEQYKKASEQSVELQKFIDQQVKARSSQ